MMFTFLAESKVMCYVLWSTAQAGSVELGLHDGQQFIMESERSLGYSIPATDARGLLPRGAEVK